MGVIYKHTNLINGKIYIGQTKYTVEKRIGTMPEKAYIHSKEFSNDIKKYGWENFKTEILEDNLSKENLNSREDYWIKYYKSNDPEIGYNKKLSHQLIYNNNKEVSWIDYENPNLIELYEMGFSMSDLIYIYDTNKFTISNYLNASNVNINSHSYKGLFILLKKNIRTKYLNNRECMVCKKSLNIHNSRGYTCCKSCSIKSIDLDLSLKKLHKENDDNLKLFYEYLKQEQIQLYQDKLDYYRNIALSHKKRPISVELSEIISKEKFIELNKQYNDAQIAKMYDLSKNHVSTLRRYYNISGNILAKNINIPKSQLIEDIKSGLPMTTLAKKYNLSSNGYGKVLKRNNLPYYQKDREEYRKNLLNE